MDEGALPRKELIMAIDVAGIRMKNPVMVASGTFGFGREYGRFYDLNKLGAIVVKGLTLKPRAGNPPPRLIETPAGLLNSIGLENPGVEGFIHSELPFLRGFDLPIIVNIAGDTVRDYAQLAAILDDVEGIAGIEVNISCPNVKAGGMAFGASPDLAYEVVRGVKKETRLPIIVKLSPNVTDIKEIALKVQEGGADAISLINTPLGMAIDVEERRPALGNVFGGLSGPAIRPIAVRMVWEVCGVVALPVIGIGGIVTARDALEFILAGASAIAIGSGNFVNPTAPLEVIEGIREYMEREGVSDIRELIGAARRESIAPR